MSLYKAGLSVGAELPAATPKTASSPSPVTRDSIKPGLASIAAVAAGVLGVWWLVNRKPQPQRGPDMTGIPARLRQ